MLPGIVRAWQAGSRRLAVASRRATGKKLEPQAESEGSGNPMVGKVVGSRTELVWSVVRSASKNQNVVVRGCGGSR